MPAGRPAPRVRGLATVVLAALLLAGCLGASTGAMPVTPTLGDRSADPRTPGPTPGGARDPAGAGAPPAPTMPVVEGRGPALLPLTLRIDNETATGLLAVPAGAPHALVVLAHGWGTSASHHEEDLRQLADDGVLAVAMDYRGSWDAFKVETGVRDTLTATLALQAAYPDVQQTILYGWSMGGAVALLSVAAAPPGTYAHVVVGSGVADVATTWAELPWVRPYVEAETGGSPQEVPAAYAARSPIHHAAAIAGRVDRVWLVHGADDVIVPAAHAHRMRDALLAVGQPVATYDAVRTTWAACVPFVPCADPVAQAAGHEAGEFRLLRPLVSALLAGVPDTAVAGVDLRGTFDLTTGTTGPPVAVA